MSLEKAIDALNKKHGKMSVTTVNSREKVDVEVIPTGSFGLDGAVGVGGYPRGRIIELFGWESSGKTTLALHAIAEAQKQGGKAAMIDAEHAFDPTYAEALGIDLDELILAQPDNGEQGLDIAQGLIDSGELSVLVVDSVSALVPRSEIEGEMGDSSVGVHARLMSQALRKITPAASRNKTCVIFINQLREKIGVMFGNPQTTTGGHALKFYSTIRIEVKRAGQPVKGSDGEASATHTKVKVIKNKVAAPFKECEFDIVYGVGISRTAELFDIAVEKEVINKSGSHYSYDETRLGQGRAAALEILEDNPELLEEIEAIIKAGSKKKK